MGKAHLELLPPKINQFSTIQLWLALITERKLRWHVWIGNWYVVFNKPDTCFWIWLFRRNVYDDNVLFAKLAKIEQSAGFLLNQWQINQSFKYFFKYVFFTSYLISRPLHNKHEVVCVCKWNSIWRKVQPLLSAKLLFPKTTIQIPQHKQNRETSARTISSLIPNGTEASSAFCLRFKIVCEYGS